MAAQASPEHIAANPVHIDGNNCEDPARHRLIRMVAALAASGRTEGADLTKGTGELVDEIRASAAPRIAAAEPMKPVYIPEERELWLGGRLLKKCIHANTWEEQLVAAFAGQDWDPPQIGNPFTKAGRKPQTLLRNTMKNLRRLLRPHVVLRPVSIRFTGDGNGGARWQIVKANPATKECNS